jgi:hypothetical protein
MVTKKENLKYLRIVGDPKIAIPCELNLTSFCDGAILCKECVNCSWRKNAMKMYIMIKI